MADYSNAIIPWIGRTAKTVDYYLSQKLKGEGFDITKEQWVLLKVLSHHNGVSQNEIACITERDKASTTRLVNKMEKKNLIARIPSKDDKRINLIFLTKQGDKILNETKELIENMIAEFQKGLEEDEIQSLITGLKKIHQNIIDTNGC